MRRHRPAALAASLLIAAGAPAGAPAAWAQSLFGQNLSAGSLGQAASGLIGGRLGTGGVPSLSSAPSGNVAGLLSYCVQNREVPSAAAAGTLNGLERRNEASPGSSAYQSGQQGLLQTGQAAGGGAGGLSLSNLPDGVRQRICDAVLNRAKSLL